MKRQGNKIIAIGLMSFASGSVFFFLASTIGIWLKHQGFCNALIGASTIITLPYALRVIFSILIEKNPSPKMMFYKILIMILQRIHIMNKFFINKEEKFDFFLKIEKKYSILQNIYLNFQDNYKKCECNIVADKNENHHINSKSKNQNKKCQCNINNNHTNLIYRNNKIHTHIHNNIYKNWAMFSQISIIFLLLLICYLNYMNSIFITFCILFILACFAVIQDIVLESYRVHITNKKIFSSSISTTYLMFRIGMMSSGAIMLFIVEISNWNLAFLFMGLNVLAGILGIFFLEKPKNIDQSKQLATESCALENNNYFNNKSCDNQNEYEELSQPQSKDDNSNSWQSLTINIFNSKWIPICKFMFLFKFCDSALHGSSNLLLIDMGYSGLEIAFIGKIFWIGFAILGALTFNNLVNKISIKKMLTFGSLAECISSGVFCYHAFYGKNHILMFIMSTIDSFTSALCSTAMLAYRTLIIKSDKFGSNKTLNVGIIGAISSISRIIIVSFVLSFVDILGWQYSLLSINIISMICAYLISKDSHLNDLSIKFNKK